MAYLSTGFPIRDSAEAMNITNFRNSQDTKESLARGSARPPQTNFQITDLLDYEKSQQKYVEASLAGQTQSSQPSELSPDIIQTSVHAIKEIDNKMEESSGVVI